MLAMTCTGTSAEQRARIGRLVAGTRPGTRASAAPAGCGGRCLRRRRRPPVGERAQRQVAGLAAIGRHEQRPAPPGTARSGARAPRRVIAGRSRFVRAPPAHGASSMRQLVQVHQPRAAQHVLDRGAAVTLPQHAHQLVLARRARSEVGVAALGRAGHGPAADPHELRLAEAGARRDDRHGAVGSRLAGLQGQHVVGVQRVQRIGQRLDVVQQLDGRAQDPARCDSRRSSRDGWSAAPPVPRTGPATPKPRPTTTVALGLQSCRNSITMRVERRGGVGLVAALGDRRRAPRRRLEQAQQRLGAADVASQDRACRRTGVRGQSLDYSEGAWDQRCRAASKRHVLDRYRHLREDHLRYMEKCGLVRPSRDGNGDAVYSFADLGLLRQADAEMADRRAVPPRAARADGDAGRPAGLRLPARCAAGQGAAAHAAGCRRR